MNLIGRLEKGFSEPIWVISNLPPEEALRIYRSRMKIDESFRDLKNLLSLEKIMNKKQENEVICLFIIKELIKSGNFTKYKDTRKVYRSRRGR
ncbi:MAG: hypothetical protein QG588_1176 [Candidatus Poribacteria bacterium]|nr:hypothetical protein [Candidatus Poribacteria bacterium]